MILADFFVQNSIFTLLSLAVLAFIAGFIDAIVGGGGLIQLPAVLINFPNTPLPTLLGTTKIAGLSGTSISAYQYSKQIRFNFKLLIIVSVFTAVASYFGAKTISVLDPKTIKPFLLVILIGIAVYTYFKKDLGSFPTKDLSLQKQLLFGSVLGIIVGFYDGFFGPGTGSFFVLGFVVLLGFDFISASAYAKLVNCIANIAALCVFISDGHFMLSIAILMAVFNITGSYFGSKMALKKGNGFVRIIFLVVVSILIVRYSFDVFYPN